MNYVFEPPKQAVIPVAGEGAAFPVRRIWCVGRNYADHTREMGGDPANDAPIFFSKQADAVTTDRTLSFPVHTDNLSHEVELVVAISGTGAGIDPDRAEDLIYGYAVGLDMTRRDLQAVAKKAGQPWDLSKGFDQSCPVSAIAPSSRIGHPAAGGITLHVNGKLRQDGKLEYMIWPVRQIIAILSTYVMLCPGDLIMTGTPSGIGPVRPGDTLHAECTGIGKLEVTYTAHS
ncbi:fumarylacetoacetate hydrolase family protein [Acetobacter oeni]|uniref:Fumarylacetoacetate (FAA) hydrolase n=1 Tax=Acetobacter oeni TaxID=304077 RepID=A0A511XNB5_9PROT|nr:fumarylacetoacetate hydrolase family protein [Acetobacter oeni]MBB3884266.1 fumarylpyruvate hydrolase [Acetobacter oeni]NHO20215.1 FAA hydrolase family protein [Acetobacter oeni]GBR06310.1 fumarylacetoacetate hydroxylase [Acetobacter oeni LMG 21952]GEN64415.1 fumarylacetoacetate (FAA) hydrolase [Acetobacter oeni]